MDCGWAAYLTLYSAESNLQSDGTPKINLNGSDLQKLHDDLARPSTPPWPISSSPTGCTAIGGTIPAGGPDLTQKGLQPVHPVLDLVGARSTGRAREARGTPSGLRLAGSPGPAALSFPQRPGVDEHLPAQAPGQNHDNVRHGNPRADQHQPVPQTVLQCIPNLTSDAVQQILSLRTPDPTQADPGRKYGTWLLSEGIVSLATMKQLMPLVTGDGSVYRAQVVGYYEDGRPPPGSKP